VCDLKVVFSLGERFQVVWLMMAVLGVSNL
jgi:hypothetical protein